MTVVDRAVTSSHASSTISSAAPNADTAATPMGAQKGLRCRLPPVAMAT